MGQKEAKKTLAVGVYQHYRRLANNLERKLRQQGGQVQHVGSVHPSNQFNNNTFHIPPNLGTIGHQFQDRK